MAFFPAPSSNEGEIKFKYFNVQKNQAFSSGQTYQFTPTEFGIGDITPKGFAMSFIGYEAVDQEGTVYYLSNKVRYYCKAPNANACIFQGIVFY